MTGRELRHALGVGHDYSSPKDIQKTLTWDFWGWGSGRGGREGGERKK